MNFRSSKQARKTGETDVQISIDIDGSGNYHIETGNGMFNHLLAQLARHGLIDIDIEVQGDVEVGWHHIVEDTAIVLGHAFKEAVGEGRGITRVGNAIVPLDEALVLSVIDYSGRGYSVIDAPLGQSDLGELPSDLVRHFLETFSREGCFNLHVKAMAGMNNHHIAEAVFKSLARALRMALSRDEPLGQEVPSTKGVIG